MTRRAFGIPVALTVLTALILAACATPTSAPDPITGTPAGTEEATSPSPTELPHERPTLPPTWTPAQPPPTVTPLPTAPPSGPPSPTPTRPPAPSEPPDPALSAACEGFRADSTRAQEAFILGASPVIAWHPIPAASAYRVDIYDTLGAVVYSEVLEGNADFYLVPPEVFDVDENSLRIAPGLIVYVWGVIPLDAAGEQICPQVGSELVPQLEQP